MLPGIGPERCSAFDRVRAQGTWVAFGLFLAAAHVHLACLYETGRGTVWTPALVHTAIDSFTLVAVPSAVQTTFSLTLAAVALVVPLLALAVPRCVLADDDASPRLARALRATAPDRSDVP